MTKYELMQCLVEFEEAKYLYRGIRECKNYGGLTDTGILKLNNFWKDFLSEYKDLDNAQINFM